MTVGLTPKRDLFLITGIPGTGKTWYGDKFASEFGFVHYDLEVQQALGHFSSNPAHFIAGAVGQKRNVVITWGFLPDQTQTALVLQIRNAGFKLIWFDGNRPAALREFIKRESVPEVCFYLQMYRIETTKVVETMKPVIIDPFDAQGGFKSTAMLLDEIRQQ